MRLRNKVTKLNLAMQTQQLQIDELRRCLQKNTSEIKLMVYEEAKELQDLMRNRIKELLTKPAPLKREESKIIKNLTESIMKLISNDNKISH